MGAETILFAAFTGLKAISTMSAAEDKAKSIKRNAMYQLDANKQQGELALKDKAKQVRQTVATNTTRFLNSGITLEGTPTEFNNETFTTGLADLNLLKSNYDTNAGNIRSMANAEIKSTIGAARSQVISDIASSFAMASMGSMFDSGGTASMTGGTGAKFSTGGKTLATGTSNGWT